MEPIAEVSGVSLDANITDNRSDVISEDPIAADESSLGERFLQALGETKQKISEQSAEIENILSVDKISPTELLKVQFKLAEVTLQQELISKGVSKSTQNVDTLLKAQ